MSGSGQELPRLLHKDGLKMSSKADWGGYCPQADERSRGSHKQFVICMAPIALKCTECGAVELPRLAQVYHTEEEFWNEHIWPRHTGHRSST